MMKRFVLVGILGMSVGVIHLDAHTHVIHNKIGEGELRIQVRYDGNCAPAGVQLYSGMRLISGIRPGQSVTLDSQDCRLSVITGNVIVPTNRPCSDQDFSEHLCSPDEWITKYTPSSYNAPAGGDGDGEWVVTDTQITKIK